jgi:hypothetical protein
MNNEDSRDRPAKHTPGPWTAFELGKEDGTWEKWSIVHNGPLCYGGDACQGPIVSEANARLIAAAPELLEACEEALGPLQDAQNGLRSSLAAKAFMKVKAAIAKAKGE